jgi:hypothetical protein
MRLLLRGDNGKYTLTADLVGNQIPPYAILSHTWGSDNEEITFEDITNGMGEEKLGYEKIQFCGEQARQDGLQYFWIDTCCINKSNVGEISQAIGSMYRWYRNATRCYVYLSDVFAAPSATVDIYNPQSWDSEFWKSRWFTRGWTLQELLAPPSVEFFSRERERLGDKTSLKHQIHEITRIPVPAIEGASLSQFSVDERFLWMEGRQTKLEEDKVYSLMGIINAKIPLFYGEGALNAFNRLREIVNKREKCIRDLRLTDPRDDKKRIEDTKGGLLKDSYHWVLETSDFLQWRNAQRGWLLWIKGDPGKGKTMLLCGIVNELKKNITGSDLLAYFFCQANDSRINNATAVLRGLIYLLVEQQPSLISYVQNKYEKAGKEIFDDGNAWVTLSDILTNILQDPKSNHTTLIVDALDECVIDLPKLLHFIVQISSVSPHVKWIISSRNWPSIEKDLDTATEKVRLCLELNEESVSAAITKYIEFKVDWLAKRNKYSSTTRDAVHRHLSLNANGTFLWVALVCQELSSTSGWKAQQKLKAFPSGLDALYQQMMDQIRNSEDAELCQSILAVVSIAYRPITLEELASIVDLPDDIAGEDDVLTEIIGLCGSFLTLRERTITFVHQSAKDFLVERARKEIYPSGIEYAHHAIFLQSLAVMSKRLKRDILGIGVAGSSIDQVSLPNPDPLSPMRYYCVYWLEHLLNSDLTSDATNDLQEGGSVATFLSRSYLYWLEALSLCRGMSEGVVSIAKFEAILQVISISPLRTINADMP